MSKKLFSIVVLIALTVSLFPLAVAAAPNAQDEGKVHSIQKDDWLSNIADKKYGDPQAYKAIVYFNNMNAQDDESLAVIENADRIEVGWSIYLPSSEESQAYMNGTGNETGSEMTGSLSGQIQLAGSTTVQPLAELLAEAFMASNSDLKIEVQGGGSSVGVTSAGEGTVDIGNASRAIKDSEMEKFPEIQVHAIAYDGIAIVTNPGLDIPTLSEEQVRNVFGGKIVNWSELGGPDATIIVVSREEGSGTRAAFEELVMEYKDESGEKQMVPIFDRALLQQSNGQVRTTVATTPDSVGYLSFGFLDDSTSGVPVDGVAPSVENVKNGSYPIFRPLNMLTYGDPSDTSQAFLDFILGSDGQVIVSADYIGID